MRFAKVLTIPDATINARGQASTGTEREELWGLRRDLDKRLISFAP
ncbi:MAG: hypothetical protein ACJAR2_003076 [Ilumatobacter sp.]